ncbi:hypothetical protein L7F22_037827 [Adiantum nelumboides]|nr:hypothetical protein [Adiantum nelumboides]
MVAARINFQQGAKRNLKPMETKEKREHKGKNQFQNSSKGNSSNNKAKEKGVYKGKNMLTPEELERYRKGNRCFKCGEKGHFYRTCPQRNARNEQPRASIIEAPKVDVHCKGSPLSYAWGKVREHDAFILFDHGSTHNFISHELAAKLGIQEFEMGDAMKADGAFIGQDASGQQTHEVGESSRPSQTEDEIFRTQLIAAVSMFTQVMQNPRFMALLQPPPPSQSIGTKKQKSEPAKAQPQVIHTAESMETPVHLPETMQSPNLVHNAQEQVAETPLFQGVPVQPATFQQPIVGSNGQGSDLQAMQQVFPQPSVHPGYFGGGSVFQSMAGHAPGNQFYTPGTEKLKICARNPLTLGDSFLMFVSTDRNLVIAQFHRLHEDETDLSHSSDVAVQSTLQRKQIVPAAPPPKAEDVASLYQFLQTSHKLAVLTGAGISTESGIPDYRSPNGAYSTGFKPITHQEFIHSEKSQKRYWARSYAGWKKFINAQPGETHTALAKLESRGYIEDIITQNVDRLHHRAGSHAFELHGTTHEVICLNCRNITSRQEFQNRVKELNPEWAVAVEAVDKGNAVLSAGMQQRPDGDIEIDERFWEGRFQIPTCEICSGMLKPNVVLFGDNLPKPRSKNALAMISKADAVLVLGSSLMVLSAFRLAKYGLPSILTKVHSVVVYDIVCSVL